MHVYGYEIKKVKSEVNGGAVNNVSETSHKSDEDAACPLGCWWILIDYQVYICKFFSCKQSLHTYNSDILKTNWRHWRESIFIDVSCLNMSFANLSSVASQLNANHFESALTILMPAIKINHHLIWVRI